MRHMKFFATTPTITVYKNHGSPDRERSIIGPAELHNKRTGTPKK